MGFNHKRYNSEYLKNRGEKTRNDAKDYGVRIIESDAKPGEIYWKIIGIHHLTPNENESKHHLYIEVLDEKGSRVQNAWADWTWEGIRPTQRADPVALDKPQSEPAGNIAIWTGQKISVWMKGISSESNDSSDMIQNVHTNHPDEPLPDGRLLNTIGHHSFYVVFQRTIKPSRKAPANSVISGKAENMGRYVVQLIRGGNKIAEVPLIFSTTYRFPNLPAGRYSVVVPGTNIRIDNIQVDGTSEHRIDLVSPDKPKPPPPVEIPPELPELSEKLIDKYILFVGRGARVNLLMAVNFILATKAVVGFSVEEAKLAKEVVIIGEAISLEDLQALELSGSKVTAFVGNPYDTEQELMKAIKLVSYQRAKLKEKQNERNLQE